MSNALIITLYLLIILLCFTVQGITGFGASILALPFLYLFMDINEVILIISIVNIFMALIMCYFYRKEIVCSELLKMSAIVLCGMVVGLYLSSIINSSILEIILGCIMIAIAVFNLVKIYGFSGKNFESLGDKSQLAIDVFILVLGGVVHGLIASGGVFIIIYASRVFKEKKQMQGTLSALWVIVNSVFIVINLIRGNYALSNFLFSLYALPVLIASIILGGMISKKINNKIFLTIIYAVLIVGGIVMLT